jgi:hypothetical protein
VRAAAATLHTKMTVQKHRLLCINPQWLEFTIRNRLWSHVRGFIPCLGVCTKAKCNYRQELEPDPSAATRQRVVRESEVESEPTTAKQGSMREGDEGGRWGGGGQEHGRREGESRRGSTHRWNWFDSFCLLCLNAQSPPHNEATVHPSTAGHGCDASKRHPIYKISRGPTSKNGRNGTTGTTEAEQQSTPKVASGESKAIRPWNRRKVRTYRYQRGIHHSSVHLLALWIECAVWLQHSGTPT